LLERRAVLKLVASPDGKLRRPIVSATPVQTVRRRRHKNEHPAALALKKFLLSAPFAFMRSTIAVDELPFFSQQRLPKALFV